MDGLTKNILSVHRLNINFFSKIAIIFTLLNVPLISANEPEAPIQKEFKQEKTILLRTPPPHSQGYFVSEVLTKLYKNLGYQVEFINVPGVRELELAEKSILSGALARDNIIEQKYKELTRVDFSLFEYQIILTGDRRVCGYCLPEHIDIIAYPNGLEIFPEIINKYFKDPKVMTLTDTKDVEEVVLKQRLPAFLNANIDYSEQLNVSPHIVKHILEVRSDYHYLSPKYAFLKPALEKGLKEMQLSGELAALKDKFAIESYSKPTQLPNNFSIKAVSGYWEEYTEVDGSGVYWKMVESGFGNTIKLKKEATSWLRAVRLFEEQKADVLVGTYKNSLPGYLPSKYHIDYETEVYAFTHDKETLTRFKNNDKDLTVCASETYELVVSKLPSETSIYNSDFFMCEQLFTNKRVDVLIEYPYNVPSYFDTYKYTQFHESLPLFLLFHNNEKGRTLKDWFDKGIEKTRRENQLSQHFLSLQDYKNARIEASKVN